MIDTILFDMDGTLLNTIDDIRDSVNVILKKYDMPQYSVEEIKSFVGNGLRRLMEQAIPDGENNPRFEAIFQEFIAYYFEHSLDKTAPYEGIQTLLKALKERNLKMAIVTSKAQKAAEDLRDQFFPEISVVIGDREGKPRKPDPRPCEEALALLQSEKDTALYIGDSEVDAKTAENSKLDLVLCSWGFRNRELLETFSAKKIIDHPMELLEVIDT